MRYAYASLGLMFIIVFGGAYLLLSKEAKAPTLGHKDIVLSNNKETTMTMKLTSSAFSNGESIPKKYTCDGENSNPPLTISDVPAGTKSLVLVMDDPDIPTEIKQKMGIEKFNHWAIYNLPTNATDIPEGDTTVGDKGLNTRGEPTYTGPCPPTEYNPTTHRYIFRLYALPELLQFSKTPTLDEIETKAQTIMLEKAELMGTYSRVTES